MKLLAFIFEQPSYIPNQCTSSGLDKTHAKLENYLERILLVAFTRYPAFICFFRSWANNELRLNCENVTKNIGRLHPNQMHISDLDKKHVQCLKKIRLKLKDYSLTSRTSSDLEINICKVSKRFGKKLGVASQDI